jgi:hypothetical protein
MPRYLYAIGAGYNLPLGSLTYIENILDYNGKALHPPQSFGTYLPGAPVDRLNSIEYERGYPTLDWNWTGDGGRGYITYGGARKLRNGYFGSLWSAELSIYTKLDDETGYSLCNAVGVLKKFPDSAPNFKAFNGFGIHMKKVISR